MGGENLIILTAKFPYGNAENFLYNELLLIAPYYKKIIVIPYNKESGVNQIKYNLPENVVVVTPELSLLKSRFKGVVFTEYFKTLISGRFIPLSYFFSYFKSVNEKYVFLEKFITSNAFEHAVILSYWMEEWATVCSLLKRNGRIDKFYSKVHGYDVFEERWSYRIIPFRKFQLKYVNKVIAPCVETCKELKKKYPKFKDKFTFAYLPVLKVPSLLNPVPDLGIIKVYTVSGFTYEKGIDRVAESLLRLNKDVQWTHFGKINYDDFYNNINSSLESSKVELICKGFIDNSSLYQILESEPYDCLFHFSRSEGGLPIVIQEAISLGIPVVAVKVGGINDISIYDLGCFVENNGTDIIDLSKLDFNKFRDPEYRKAVRQIWELHFHPDLLQNNLIDVLS